MKFYCLFDLIDFARKKQGHTEDEMFQFFKHNGIKKSVLKLSKNYCALDSMSELVKVAQKYTSMSYLEICLSLGYIPEEYVDSCFSHISEISHLILSDYQKREPSSEHRPVFFETDLGKLYNADCIKVMQTMASDSVDLIFADPPFNICKTYDEGIHDDLGTSEYLSWCTRWLSECIRILKPGGSLFVYNIPKWASYFAEYLNKRLTFRSWIAVNMKMSLPLSGRLNPTHYALLYYVKGDRPNAFNNQRIPIETCRHCGGEIKDYGGYKNKMNPLGVNVSDVWNDIYPVRHKNTKNRSYNELSIKLLDRIISMASNPGDLVFDPFGGSGTTFVVAELLNRRWMGTELGNCEIISERFHHIAKDQALLEKVQQEKNIIFTEEAKKLRIKNGFWLAEDFEDKEDPDDVDQQQLTLKNI